MSEKDKLKELKEKIVKLEKKAEDNLDGWKRAKADYINFKKESETKQTELIQFVTTNIVGSLLPVLSSFKQAVKHIPKEQEKENWVVGIIQTKKQIDSFLKDLGLEEIKTVGEKFNPEFHEAVDKKKVSETDKGENKVEEGTIIEEVSSGYKMGDKVVIPAKVIVSE